MTYRQKQSRRKSKRMIRRHRRKRWCRLCSDGAGGCCYPWYGSISEAAWEAITPETVRDRLKPGDVVHYHLPLERSEWPKNFSEDRCSPGQGTFTHCLHCGNPPRRMR